ncbi:MAG: Asp-tRNA(Asn)/Glu-tRNA(Gln) amidotransferase subunit GatC [Lachnospiraceae bacterium]|nr:Asp-tRNA(Asn)/Glu-tRNA(Gln) amidotransferase subunit GatC [Lachnospiraceae bacterium]MBR4604868.1 Asp-tRNA(Asn)/Glu-tRNA(Gln) amidotransferase subunit GatC [Lachnospiraceae bacterium]
MPMVNEKVLERVSRLAELELPKERDQVLRDFQRLVDFAGMLEGLQLGGVEPLYQVNEEQAGNAFREDLVTQDLDREEALENAPKRRGEFFEVPKTF